MEKRLYPALGFAFVLLSILACGTTTTDEPGQQIEQPTSEPAAAPADTAVPPTAEPTQATAEQYFTEEFDSDTGNWSQVVALNGDEGHLDEADVTVEDGRLNFKLDKWLLAYRLYDPYEYEDVKIETRVDNRGTNINNVLLICRASDEGLYLVNIANSGLYAMYAWEAEPDVWTRIADGGSNRIRSGKETNEYTLECRGRDLILSINGNKTRNYTDNRFVFRSGKIGIGVASEDQIPVQLEFESVTISEP
jgi:hypothetical protein